MEISVDVIKELRELTSCGVIECKNALEEVNGDINEAKKVLQKRGLELAAKKGGRAATEGRVEAYIHSGSKVGVLLEVKCETDFVASNDAFVAFTKDIAMHIAAVAPKYVRKEDIPENVLSEQTDQESYVKESCLLEQPFVKDPKKTIAQYTTSLVASMGENIFVNRFSRFKINEVL